MSIKKFWDVHRLCVSLNNGMTRVGFCFAESTVEDMKGGDNMIQIEEIWNSSDPNNTDKFGRTGSWMVRWFRNH